MGAIGQVGNFATDKPLENNYVGSALNEVENQGFKYRAEQRLADEKKKEDDDAKLQKLNEWNKSVKADLTGYGNVDFPIKEYLMRIKEDGGKLTQKINDSNLSQEERLKAMGQRDAYTSSIDYLKQIPTLLNSTLADLHEGVKSGKYDEGSENKALETVKAIQSGDFKIDPTTGNPVVTVWQRDKEGNAVKILADKQNFGDFIKDNLSPKLKSTWAEQVSKYKNEYKPTERTWVDTNGHIRIDSTFDKTPGSQDMLNATEKAKQVLQQPHDREKYAESAGLAVDDYEGQIKSLTNDIANGITGKKSNLPDHEQERINLERRKQSKENETANPRITDVTEDQNDRKVNIKGKEINIKKGTKNVVVEDYTNGDVSKGVFDKINYFKPIVGNDGRVTILAEIESFGKNNGTESTAVLNEKGMKELDKMKKDPQYSSYPESSLIGFVTQHDPTTLNKLSEREKTNPKVLVNIGANQALLNKFTKGRKADEVIRDVLERAGIDPNRASKGANHQTQSNKKPKIDY